MIDLEQRMIEDTEGTYDEWGLTKESVQELRQYIIDHDAEVYWDQNDRLWDEHITALVEQGYDAFADAVQEWLEDSDYLWTLEVDHVMYAIDHLGIEYTGTGHSEKSRRSMVWDIMQHYEIFPNIDPNLNQILRMSRHNAYIGLRLDLYYNGGYDLVFDEETRKALTFFQMNPRMMSDYLGLSPKWPNYEWRNGRETVTPKELASGWVNQFYPGQYVVMVHNDVLLDLKDLDLNKPIRLTRPRFAIHDFMNGANADFFTKDIVVHPKYIDGLYNDGALKKRNSWNYGIQYTSGFVMDAWQTGIEQVED